MVVEKKPVTVLMSPLVTAVYFLCLCISVVLCMCVCVYVGEGGGALAVIGTRKKEVKVCFAYFLMHYQLTPTGMPRLLAVNLIQALNGRNPYCLPLLNAYSYLPLLPRFLTLGRKSEVEQSCT